MECRDQSCTKRNSKFHRWEIHFGRFRRNTIESSWHSALIKGECVRQDKTVRETKTKQPIRFCDLTRSWDTNRNWFSSRNVREISSSKNRTTRLGQLYLLRGQTKNHAEHKLAEVISKGLILCRVSECCCTTSTNRSGVEPLGLHLDPDFGPGPTTLHLRLWCPTDETTIHLYL